MLIKTIMTAMISVLLMSAPALAGSTNNNGFEEDTTMGNSGKEPKTDGATNSKGTKTESGPKGALKNDNTPDDNVQSSGPGNSQH